MNKYLCVSLGLSALAMTLSTPANAAGLTSLSEGFENVSSLPGIGLSTDWSFQNLSNPAPLVTTPTANWGQGVADNPFNAQAGATNSYIYADNNSTSGNPDGFDGQLNNWLITPELDFSLGGTFSFYTRTFLGNDRPEYIEVRQSNAGSSTNVGTFAFSVGDFTTLVGSVGSLNDPLAFPGAALDNNQWGFYAFNILPTSGSGRLAFRYFATDSGVNGTQGQYAAIDTVNFAVPEPSSMAGMLLLGGFAAAYRLRNKVKKAKA
jgi:hypothetical protein